MNLVENIMWKEIVSKLEEKFQKRFGTHCNASVSTFGGRLFFANGKLKITVSDSFYESSQDFDIASYFDLSSLTESFVQDVEALFLLGMKNEESDQKKRERALAKLNLFFDKEF